MFGFRRASDGYDEARRKSQSIFQYKCTPCGNITWWGAAGNAKCNRCQRDTLPLPLTQMIGIGWFTCTCGRRFAGFSRGNVTSKCHGCHTEVLPEFIVQGDSAQNELKERRNSHYCSVCRGGTPCPIVQAAKGAGGGRFN